MTYIEVTYIIFIALCFGSFANVCIYRLPYNKSLLTSSECYHCQKSIPFYLNIPIIAFFLLNRKSACCQKALSWQYPIVEALTALGGVYLYLTYGLHIESILAFAFFLALTLNFSKVIGSHIWNVLP